MARVARECGTEAYPAGVVSLTVHAEADKLRPVRAQVADEDVRDVVAVVHDEIRRERGEGDVACVQAEARAAEALGVRLTTGAADAHPLRLPGHEVVHEDIERVVRVSRDEVAHV